MSPVVVLHIVAAALLLALSAITGVWGLAMSRKGRGRPNLRLLELWRQAIAFTWTLVAATGLLGLALLGSGKHPGDPLHARVYGPFMVFVVIAALGFRTGDQRWNTRVLSVASLFILALGVRAAFTGY